MYGTLLVPLDGSERAETALRFAELIPSQTIRLVAVEPVRLSAARDRWARDEEPPGGGTWLVSSPRAYLELIGLPLREQGRGVEVVVTRGQPVSASSRYQGTSTSSSWPHGVAAQPEP